MARFLITYVAVIAVVMGLTWIWVLMRPMSFLDWEYPVWRAKMDMAVALPANSVVILGDSRPMVSLIPARLGPDVFNLAVPGVSSIETLAFARLVLSAPHPPRAILLSLAARRCITENIIFERGVKFGLLDWAATDEVRVRSRRYHDLVYNAAEDWNPPILSPLFGPETLGDLDARLKTDLYCLHFPSYYYDALTGGYLFRREAGNLKFYHEIWASRGHKLLATDYGCRDLSPETMTPDFVPAPLLDSYLAEMVGLFQSRNIPVYWVGCPLSDLSIAALHPGYAAELGNYFKSYEARYPNFHLLDDPLPTMPWIDFGDRGHLNEQGAEIFSDHISALLREKGIER